MEHKTILCSAKILSGHGLVSGFLLKNCDDFGRWKLVTESYFTKSLQQKVDWIVSGDLIYGLSS